MRRSEGVVMNGSKTEESLKRRRTNKKRKETDGFWSEGVEREGRRGGDSDKLQPVLTNGSAKVFRIRIQPAERF